MRGLVLRRGCRAEGGREERREREMEVGCAGLEGEGGGAGEKTRGRWVVQR